MAPARSTPALPLLLLLLLAAAARQASGAATTRAVELPHCELIPGTVEEEGKCVCQDRDSIYSPTNTALGCLKVAFDGYGASCQEDFQCQERMGENAVCLESTGTCSCGDGYHYLHGVCWRDAGYGEECEDHAQCTDFGEWDAYACVNNVCTCAADAQEKLHGARPLCRRIARDKEECESNLDCIEELICNNPTGQFGTYCHESTAYNAFNASIDRKRAVGVQSLASVKSSSGAESRADCEDNELPTAGGQCVCQQGYFRPSDSSPCIPELGEPCLVGDENADIDFSVCRRSAKSPYVPPTSKDDIAAADENGVWSCIGGFAPAPSNRECEKTRAFNFNCMYNSQCGYYGGVCIDKRCICDKKYHYMADKQLCWPASGLDESCLYNEDCVVETPDSAECAFGDSAEGETEGICVCKSGHHPAKGDCMKNAYMLGENCINDIDCAFADGDVSVVCTEGKCACREGYSQYNPTTCLYEVTSKCEIIEGAIEENGECICENRDYIIDGSRSKCIKRAFGGADAPCEESLQCLERMGQGAGCVDGKCTCLEGFHYLHGQCWFSKGFNESCIQDAECYQFAESDAYACVDNVCKCAPDANPRRPGDKPICRRNAREGEECESTLDCIENLICNKTTPNALDFICKDLSQSSQALSNTRYTEGGSRARRSVMQRQQMAAPEEGDARLSCGPNEQMTPNQTACMCRRGYFEASATSGCVPELGEPCYVGDDPHIEYASCRRSAKFAYSPPTSEDEGSEPDGVWACLGGFVATPNNRECEKTRQNAYNCQIDAQCGYYGGTCVSKSCRCESNHHYATEKFLCWPSKGLGEECDSDADCNVKTANSTYCRGDDLTESEATAVITDGICDCKSGYHTVGTDCRMDAYELGESCEGTVDCVFGLDDPTIICDYGKCGCTTGYFEYNKTTCQTGVGGICSETLECRNVEHSECVDGICTCEDGYVGYRSRKCLPIATEYGQECEDEDQCTPLTPGQYTMYCHPESLTCSCWPNMHYRNETCWNSKYLNQKCGHASECIVENSVCRNNYCTCDYGYVEDGSNRCVNGAPVSVVAGSVFSMTLVALASYLM